MLHWVCKKIFLRISHKVGNQYVDVVDHLFPELGGVEPIFHVISFSKHDIEIEGVEAQHSKDTVQENSCKNKLVCFKIYGNKSYKILLTVLNYKRLCPSVCVCVTSCYLIITDLNI